MHLAQISVTETVHTSEQLKVYGKETVVVKCPAGHILFSYFADTPLPRNFRTVHRCKSCKKYYEVSID